jgi:uncharacterized protein (DUF952 family)
LAATEWAAALGTGLFTGSAVDLADGFIHFSTADQARETARRHFSGQTGLMILVVESETLGPDLRWERSRGGDLFPHLYATLATSDVLDARPAPLGDDDVPSLGDFAP